MILSFSTTGRLLKGALAAATVTLSLGAATLSSVEPAQAYDGYSHHRHFGGFHPYRYGFRHRGFAYRPFFHRPFVRYGARPFYLARAPFYGYGYPHRLHRAWGRYAWHHRFVY